MILKRSLIPQHIVKIIVFHLEDKLSILSISWFQNPQADLQAQDRCHRIGQTKPILVYRLVTANTVDQKMVERAACKRKLEKLVIHKGNFLVYWKTSIKTHHFYHLWNLQLIITHHLLKRSFCRCEVVIVWFSEVFKVQAKWYFFNDCPLNR